MSDTPQIDLGAIEKEIAGMSADQLEAEYLKFRVRQKTQQKKQQGSGSQKAYQLKRRAVEKLIKERIAAAGKTEALEEAVEAQADAKHKEWLDNQPEPGDQDAA